MGLNLKETGKSSGGTFEPLPEGRRAVAELIRTMQEGEPLLVKMRPMGTSRQPPLDAFARELMRDTNRMTQELAGKRPLEEIRDRPPLSCQIWSQ